ncbi:MAG: polysaccharide deacetylase family protein [Aquificaceae bacterium]
MKVLTYHNVDKAPKGAKLKTLYVKPSQLEGQIVWLKRLGYYFGKSDDLLKGGHPKGVILTFDDAYLDFWEKALDILKKYKVPAIVFVPAGLVGTYNQWDYQKLNVKKPLMDWWHLRELTKMGIEIGSHSLTHPYLSQISPQRAKEEIKDSKSLLEDKLGVEIKSFCYPYGDYNSQVRDLVADAGYKLAFTTKEGKVEDSPNLFEIKRITVFGNDFLPKFLLKIAL